MVKRGMVSLSFSSFLFGLFVSISLHSFAFSHKDMEKQVVGPAITLLTGMIPNLSLQKEEIFNAVPTRAEAGISGRKMMKMRRVLRHRSSSRSRDRHRHGMKVRMGSFVAINADYKAPQFHPPRNN